MIKKGLPAAGRSEPNPRRSIRSIPAFSAMPDPAHAPQFTLSAAMPCSHASTEATAQAAEN